MPRTRAHPSPGGLQSLPIDPPRKTRKPKAKGKAKGTAKAELTSKPPATSSGYATNTAQRQSPPTATSRSQSPRLESGSQSPPQLPESRSTSPPTHYYTRSQTRSMSPSHMNASEQQPEGKRSNRSVSRKRSRNQSGPSIYQGVGNSDADTAGDQRPTKRTRTQRGSYTLQVDETRKSRKSTRPAADNTSSDELDIGQRSVFRNRSRSTSHQLALTASPHRDDDTSEPESDERLEPTRATPSNSIQKRRFISPKSTRTKSTKRGEPRNADLVPEDMLERERLYEAVFKTPMPAVKVGLREIIKAGFDSYGPRPDIEESYIEEEDGEEYTRQQLSKWRNDPKTFRRDKFPFNLPAQSTDYLEAERKKSAKASSARPSTKPSKSTKIIIPASHFEEEQVLTRPDLIDATRSLVKWAERDESHRIPNAEQMESLLESFNAAEMSKVKPPAISSATRHELAHTSPESNTSRRHHVVDQRAHDHESSAFDDEMSEGEYTEGIASREFESEVQATILEPQTPVPKTQPQAQESRGWWTGVSAVKSMLTTPLHFFGRRNQPSADTATTNGEPVPSHHIERSRIPQTSDFSQPPNTPTPSLHRRQAGAHTERRRRVQTPQRVGPQTERRPRHRDEPKPPIHLRGILSPSRIAQIHREQDINAEARRKRRESHAAQAEEDDVFDAPQSVQPTQVGEKRKRRPGTVRTPPRGPPGTFRVPSPTGSSDDSDDEEGEIEVIENDLNSKKALSQERSASPEVGLTEEEMIMANSPFAIYTNNFQKKHGKPKPGTWDDRPFDPTCCGPLNLYTGSLFQQPAAVQANIDAGLYPLSSKASPSRQQGPQNVFEAMGRASSEPIGSKLVWETGPGIPSAFEQWAKNHQLTVIPSLSGEMASSQPSQRASSLLERPTIPEGHSFSNAKSAHKAFPNSFQFPVDNDSDSDGDEADDEQVIEKLKEADGNRSTSDASVLQPKQWTQTPPPKPRPGNAQLPQSPAQPSAADLAKARAEKFKPKQPSGLRNVTQMSPLQAEQENRVREAQSKAQLARGGEELVTNENERLGQESQAREAESNEELSSAGQELSMNEYLLLDLERSRQIIADLPNLDHVWEGFDPEVIAAVMAIPDDQIIETKIPDWVWEGARRRTSVDREVSHLLR